MGKGAIYARVSTEIQREKHTIESQLSILSEIMKQRGYIQVKEPYIDNGISGETIDERPAMMTLLADAQLKLFDAIFVIDVDRLTRSQMGMDWGRIVFTCRVNRIRIITPSQDYDLNSPEAVLIASVFANFSGYEKTKIISRMRRGKHEKVKQGKYIGGKVPYGYMIDENKNYQPLENEANIIRDIFKVCISGYSLEKIQDYLFDKRYPTPHGECRKWANSTIRGVLTNPMYRGDFRRWTYERVESLEQLVNHTSKKPLSKRHKDDWILNQIPPIIDKTTFDLAQEALKSRRVLSTRNSKREYLLSGIIYCESCGCKMTGQCYMRGRDEKKEERYYVCWNGRRKHLNIECPNRSINASDIETGVWDTMKTLLTNPKLLKKAVFKAQSETVDSIDADLDCLKRQLTEKDNQSNKLIDLYQNNHITKEQFITRNNALKKEEDSIKKQMESLSDRRKVDTTLKTVTELVIELKSDIDSFNYENKRHVLQLLKVAVYVSPDYSVEIRGSVDFRRLNKIDVLDNAVGIENTSY